MTFEQFKNAWDWALDQIGLLASLTAAVCVALYGQSDIHEPWRHILSILGLAGSVLSAALLKTRKPKEKE